MTVPSFVRAFLAIVLLTVSVGLNAQQPPTFVERATRPDFSKVEIKATRLAEDFYTLEGVGSTRTCMEITPEETRTSQNLEC